MTVEPTRLDDVAAATVACVCQSWLPNYLPAEKHDDLGELIYDLIVGAVHAYVEVEAFRLPEPSRN